MIISFQKKECKKRDQESIQSDLKSQHRHHVGKTINLETFFNNTLEEQDD